MPWTKIFTTQDEAAAFTQEQGLRSLRYKQALAEAQSQLLESDEQVFVFGEGVDDPGGVFGSTKGLAERFGPTRVFDTPIAENALAGIAIGAAAAGKKPIFVHMRMDFLPMCADQIINHAAKWHYMTGGRVNIPLVIRCIVGRGWGSAAQHSQSLHGMFLGVPGLKVIMPTTPYDAKGMLIAASRDGNPVICIEHRWLFDDLGYVPEEMYEVPLGQAVIRREGSQVTVVAVSQMLREAMKAAAELEALGIDVEVIDPRSLFPLDEAAILTSLEKTGRLLVVDLGAPRASFASEVCALVAKTAPQLLRAPVKTISFPDAPTPAASILENSYYPGAADIVAACAALCGKA